MPYKPIVVIIKYLPIRKSFDNLPPAEKYAEKWKWPCTIYRREDWYQEKCKQVDELIKESLENEQS